MTRLAHHGCLYFMFYQPAPLPRFASRDEYRAWTERDPARTWERHGNQVVNGPTAEVIDRRLKHGVRLGLETAIGVSGVPCEMLRDGFTVGVEEDTDYEPAAVIACARPPKTGPAASPPMIVVEILGSAISHRDINIKLADYFLLPSVCHCLVVMTDKRQVIHHRRGRYDELLTRVHQSGPVRLDPPGLTFAVEDLYT